MLIAEVDHLTKGQFLVPDNQDPVAGSSSTTAYAEDERKKIEDGQSFSFALFNIIPDPYSLAIVVKTFLESSESQLTYYGLFHLAATLEADKLHALFRGSHLSVIYKSSKDESLYTLVTDSVFLNEPSVVWERFEDVDGSSSWVDSNFIKSSPAGGDFAGRTGEDVLRAAEAQRQAELGLVGIETPGE